VIFMMSGFEINRRGIDYSIHDRRTQIAEFDQQLHALRLSGVTDVPKRDAILAARSELSAAQGFDKASARREEKARGQQRQPVIMTRNVAVRIV
jgi:hypothetical protein